MTLVEEALKHTTDTKACTIGAGATEAAAGMFKQLFPEAKKAIIVEDPRTRAVAGERVERLLEQAGIECSRHVMCPGGEYFHAEYKWIDEVRGAIAASGAIPVAVGSGTVNDIVKRSSEEVGVRYMVVGTAASMDGYTSFGASITKDGMKQTLSCKAPLGCIVDSKVAADAPKEMVASGYADLLAKIPAGAEWILADAIGSEAIHPMAWKFVQEPLRDSLSDPEGAASGDIAATEKLCSGLVMSGFAMQAMGSSRPASGLDVDAAVAAWWPNFESVAATFPKVFGNRPAHIQRAMNECPNKFPSREQLRVELTTVKNAWPELSEKMKAQIMPFDEVRECLKKAGAPYEPEMIGVSRSRLRETYAGVPYMRARYFSIDLVDRLGLSGILAEELFGRNGIWETSKEST